MQLGLVPCFAWSMVHVPFAYIFIVYGVKALKNKNKKIFDQEELYIL
jgi:hypothetical protein